MSLTSKSPRKVALVALAVGTEALRPYAHRFAPKVFTQPQLFACLVLMVYEGWDYRAAEQHLRDLPALGQWLGLRKVPDHSTLHKAAQRFFGPAVTARLLACTVRRIMGRRRWVRLAALDSTGFESHHVSPYFVRRRQRGQTQRINPLFQTTTYTRFPKLAALCDCATHLILAALPARGPSADQPHFAAALDAAARCASFSTLLADAGYDGEAHHRYAREEHGVRSIIPPKAGRPTSKPPSGHYRRLMAHCWQRLKKTYGQRWQDETVFSMIKRNLRHELTSRKLHAQHRELRWLAVVHNIMILLFKARFSTEQDRPGYSVLGQVSVGPS